MFLIDRPSFAAEVASYFENTINSLYCDALLSFINQTTNRNTTLPEFKVLLGRHLGNTKRTRSLPIKSYFPLCAATRMDPRDTSLSLCDAVRESFIQTVICISKKVPYEAAGERKPLNITVLRVAMIFSCVPELPELAVSLHQGNQRDFQSQLQSALALSKSSFLKRCVSLSLAANCVRDWGLPAAIAYRCVPDAMQEAVRITVCTAEGKEHE